MATDIKQHWETIYETKQPSQVSWTQEVPEISLAFIHQFNIPKNASIIDIGGGDSKLVDYLLKEGFTNISVLDISAAAIEKAKLRLGSESDKVTWIVSDILDFHPAEKIRCVARQSSLSFSNQSGKYQTLSQCCKKCCQGNGNCWNIFNRWPKEMQRS
ncbi:MAG: class I SAM-dependent methyltransferase [Lacibacter sp.]